MKLILVVYILCLIPSFTKNKNFHLIISMFLNNQSISDVILSIKSILNQNVNQTLYTIVLMVSNKNKNIYISNDFISFINKNGIKLIIINKSYIQNRIITTFKKWSDNTILIINDNLIFPEGWLQMFIDDHMKYPKDIISGSIQYFIGQNFDIKNFTEGYKGKYFGTFNHITNLIFNFAFVNIGLGGTLFPSHPFKNEIFYNRELFSKISKKSNDFWISCFIMLENKILRQSSKIYDYSQYIINKDIFINDSQQSIKENLIRMITFFPWFKSIVSKRQKKVIISLTSYPQRFEFLPSVIDSIKNQSFLISDIKLVLYKKDKNLLKYDLHGIDILSVNEDLKPHKKYYYTMSKFKNYAIITIDDDIIYCRNAINSIYKSYLDHPNVVSGRDGHFMKYDKNGELTDYLSWFDPSTSVNEIDFNNFLIGIGGIIYPPDILNINERHLNIINEFLIADDFVLKHLQIQKGIEQKLIKSNHPQGLYEKNNSLHKPLFNINKYRNDFYIKKINTAISEEIIKDLCINYKNIRTGLTIYLFNINNIIINRTLTTFSIDAYSFCPIDKSLIFKIKFDKVIASCKFNESFSSVEKNFKVFETKTILIANCFINRKVTNFNKYYFPKIITSNSSNLIMLNKNRYIPIIFKDLYFIGKKKYILKLIFFKSFPKYFHFNYEFNDIKLNCSLNEEVIYKNDIQPITKKLTCHQTKSYDINKSILISGLTENYLKQKKSRNNKISNIFIISKIYIDKINKSNFIIIKGSIKHDLEFDIFDFKIEFATPKSFLICSIQSGTKYVLFYISCKTSETYMKNLFLENQIIYSENYDYNLLLINNETLFQNYRALDNNNDYQIYQIIKAKDDSIYEIINKIILILFIVKFINNRYDKRICDLFWINHYF